MLEIGAWDWTGPVLFFPVRHHSPACSRQLLRTLARYQPEVVLIEGPADATALTPHIGAAENTAPLCLYYTYKEAAAREGEKEARRYACYFPLLDFSPELCAIRYGVARGIETRFIDLPYDRLATLSGEPGEAANRAGGKNSYYDDEYLFRSRFIQRICAREGCRHFAEFWEKRFELDGMDMAPEDFVRAMLALCHFTRLDYPEPLLREEGCLAREEYMLAHIRQARTEFKRVLVVTGGFHTAALAAGLRETPAAPSPRPGREPVTGEAQVWLIPYSFAESDQLAGYASGMPYPAFYQALFERLPPGGGAESGEAWTETTRRFLALLGAKLRREKETISLADEAAAALQAGGLAALRGKPGEGVYELLDAVRSVYIKGAMDFAAERTMRAAALLLRGDRMGRVVSGAAEAPLLLDFRATARRLRLRLQATTAQKIELSILSNKNHREKSVFFHRLRYLGVSLAEMTYGPDYLSLDAGRVREIWTYTVGARVEAEIIDASGLGGTLAEAAATALALARETARGTGELARLLINAAVMDLTRSTTPLAEAMAAAVAEDGSFLSLTTATRHLLFLENAKWLLALPEENFAAALLPAVYLKAVVLLPTLRSADEATDGQLVQALKTLRQAAERDGCDRDLLTEAMLELRGGAAPPGLLGAAVGLLYADGALTAADVLAEANGFFFGSGEQMKRSGRFLSGLLQTAWDIVFSGDGFLAGLNNLLTALPHEDFLALLPDLRLAFSFFTPTQTDRLARGVARLLGTETATLSERAVPEAVYALGRELDAYYTIGIRD
ncbi:MAG: DUF5682 family protein [Gracilibacteraceae bacterium]|jgi:hypothetical protein|nr:DUF5682 family protein [Gracilibacteraceae bacterium]